MTQNTGAVPLIVSQPNQYDKVLRENMEMALPGIVKRVLGIDTISSEEIQDDIQHTKERKPDLLKKVLDRDEQHYVLHIEYQSGNDKNMVFRMAEYSIMLQRKHRLWVKQYVIFIGKGKPTMTQNITTDDFKFRYNIITLSDFDYKDFLKSDNPEEKVLAILAGFKDDPPDVAIKNILQAVKSTTGSGLARQRYFNQIRILGQLRNLQLKINKAMEHISTFFKEERDPLYIKGRKIGESKGKLKGKLEGKLEEAITIATELKKMGTPIANIVKATKLPIDKIEALEVPI